MSTLIVCTAWIMSIYGWSIARRAFELSDTDADLGPAVSFGSRRCDDGIDDLDVDGSDRSALDDHVRDGSLASERRADAAVSLPLDGRSMRGTDKRLSPMAEPERGDCPARTVMGITITSERRGRWFRGTEQMIGCAFDIAHIVVLPWIEEAQYAGPLRYRDMHRVCDCIVKADCPWDYDASPSLMSVSEPARPDSKSPNSTAGAGGSILASSASSLSRSAILVPGSQIPFPCICNTSTSTSSNTLAS